MISEEDFEKELVEFIDRTKRIGGSMANWKICDEKGEMYGAQSMCVEVDSEVMIREIHIVYNSIYRVPVLWFNVYERDGRPLPVSELTKILKFTKNESNDGFTSKMSYNEHPKLGVLYFNIHPCNTRKIVSELKSNENYICKWLSIYGQEIGLTLPLEMFKVE